MTPETHTRVVSGATRSTPTGADGAANASAPGLSYAMPLGCAPTRGRGSHRFRRSELKEQKSHVVGLLLVNGLIIALGGVRLLGQSATNTVDSHVMAAKIAAGQDHAAVFNNLCTAPAPATQPAPQPAPQPRLRLRAELFGIDPERHDVEAAAVAGSRAVSTLQVLG